MIEVLVLYYSRHGHVKAMAEQIARGVLSVTGCSPRLRTVPPWGAADDAIPAARPTSRGTICASAPRWPSARRRASATWRPA